MIIAVNNAVMVTGFALRFLLLLLLTGCAYIGERRQLVSFSWQIHTHIHWQLNPIASSAASLG